jgi:hypothetical protein
MEEEHEHLIRIREEGEEEEGNSRSVSRYGGNAARIKKLGRCCNSSILLLVICLVQSLALVALVALHGLSQASQAAGYSFSSLSFAYCTFPITLKPLSQMQNTDQ